MHRQSEHNESRPKGSIKTGKVKGRIISPQDQLRSSPTLMHLFMHPLKNDADELPLIFEFRDGHSRETLERIGNDDRVRFDAEDGDAMVEHGREFHYGNR